MSSDSAADILILGAGPAGLMAACAASAAGARVHILEKLPRPGRKLLATGGGHCNVTNAAAPERFMAAFGRQGRFMEPALAAFGRDALLDFFAREGVPVHAPDGVQFFPDSRNAGDILDALLRVCTRQNVRILCGQSAERLVIDNGTARGVLCSNADEPFLAQRVILATGGRGYPSLGGGGSGYELARRAGHAIRDPLPGLVGLTTVATWPHALAGLVVDPVTIAIDLPRLRGDLHTGPLLFTHTGISGIPIIDLSATVAEQLAKHAPVPLAINLRPDMTAADWDALWQAQRREDGARRIVSVLRGYLASSLADALLTQCRIASETTAARWTTDEQRTLTATLTGLRLEISATDGFDKAMVTRGGVSLKDIDPHTLESRHVKGLYVAGETLDLDGPCGGYNLQWAFSSGFLAGTSAARD